MLSTLVLSILLMPLWTNWVPWSVSFVDISSGVALTGFLILVAIGSAIGLLAGLYPSLFLSGYDFQHLLQGLFRVSRKGILLRKSMLVGQFIISICLLCSVVIISGQMNYLKKMNPGFARG
ncbi:MAG: hypothetical protein WDM78_16595 [Puia sp.]